MDNILGKMDENGAVVEWPQQNIMGGSYTPPGNRVTVGVGVFVVIPAGFTQWERVEDIKAQLNKPASKSKVKVDEAVG